MQAPKRRILTGLVLSFIFVAAGVGASTAEAQLFTRAELRCRKGVTISARRYFERSNKARQQCFAQIIQGKQSSEVDCAAGIGDPKLDARLRHHRARLGRLLPKFCVGVNPVLLDFPGICNDDNGAPFTFSDLEECVVEETDTAVAQLYTMYYPAEVEFVREEFRHCMLGVAGRAATALRQERRRREQCLLKQENQRLSLDVDCRARVLQFGEGTGSAKIDRSLRNALNALFSQLPQVCAAADLAKVGYDEVCPDDDGGAFGMSELAECLFDKNAAVAGVLLDIAFPSEPVCGNGQVEGEEECDEGVGQNSDTVPDACRVDCTNPVCGDSIADTGSGELCDDGGTEDGDGCTATCQFEFCDDFVVNNGGAEDCDDGPELNVDEPDKCRSNCALPLCADGITDPGSGEQCDDANVLAEDGCSPECLVEFCGDAIVQAGLGEECDNGDTNSATDPDACRPVTCLNAFCGDGVSDPGNGEACDDGNTDDSDGCTNNCTICGDGVLDEGEECDDASANSDTTPDACRTNCQNPTCGDSVVDPGNSESCDDGNVSDNDLCPTTCEAARCSDGFVCNEVGCTTGPLSGAEVCDDGNANSDTAPDACRADCSVAACGDGVADSGEQCDGSARSGCLSNEACLGSCECKHLCPGFAELTLFSGAGPECATDDDCIVGTCDQGIGHCRTTTELDTGWTGISHDADINDLTITRAFIDCPSTGPVCGECEVVGVDPSAGNCRCSADNRTQCDETFGVDSDCSFGSCVSKLCSGDGVTPCNDQAGCAGNGTCRGECSGNSDVVCTTDSVCSEAICNCYLGTPFPLSAGGTPACVVNRFFEDVFGTGNVDTGASEVTANLRTQVFLGVSIVNPCPSCGGVCEDDTAMTCSADADCGSGICLLDAVANDGERGGICLEGEDEGKSCDVAAFNTSFPARSQTTGGAGYSLDCFPDVGKNVSGAGLRIELSQRTGQVQMDSEVVCGNNPALLCPCKQCSGDPTVSCNRDADCADQQANCSIVRSAVCTANADCAEVSAGTCNLLLGRCSTALTERCSSDDDCAGIDGGVCDPSTCSSVGAGNSVQPNQCSDGICVDEGGGEASCNIGPNDRTCDGVVRANGGGILGCGTNADCAPSVIGIDGGNCTLSKRRKCFLDPIVAEGVADPGNPIGAAVFCIPPTVSAAINGVAGLPGPARVVNQGVSVLFCAEDPDSVYTPGVGGCP